MVYHKLYAKFVSFHEKEGLTLRNRILLPAVALCGGAAGFAVRKWQWLSAYDRDTELFVRGAAATYALVGLLAVLAVILLVCTRKAVVGQKIALPPVCEDPVYMCLMVSGGFVFMGAGVLGLLEGMSLTEQYEAGMTMMASYPAALLLCGGLSLASGVCTLLMGKAAYRPGTGSGAGLFAVLPPFALLVWLFATHQEHATDPVLMRYGVYLAAAALLMLAHYDVAAFYQKYRHTHRFLFCALMGTVLSVTALADGLSMFQMAMAAACVLSGLAQCYALLTPPADPEL